VPDADHRQAEPEVRSRNGGMGGDRPVTVLDDAKGTTGAQQHNAVVGRAAGERTLRHNRRTQDTAGTCTT
jgi:hypothetical protein